MAAVKVTTLWTAFISLLVTLLASLGFATSAKAAQQSSAQHPEGPAGQEPTAQERSAHGPTAQERSAPGRTAHGRGQTADVGYGPWQGMFRSKGPRDRSLPPTIKQRIGAEAHGASPAVRHMPAQNDSGLAAALASPASWAAQDSSPVTDDARVAA
ncbi:DUF6344 domain-containing protein [Streptomyces sp. NPDC054841]